MAHRRAVTDATRILIKVGTSVVTQPDGTFALGRLGNLVEQIAELRKKSKEVIVVTSGAVGQGIQVLRRNTSKSADPTNTTFDPRACAAAGQSGMMALYEALFAQKSISCAQVLLTDDDFKSPTRRETLKGTLNGLLKLGIVPILNENDVISERKTPLRDESGAIFWDNDSLAALIATEISADLLLLLSDIEGLYNKRPDDPDARVIGLYRRKTEIIVGNKSRVGRGGIEAKIQAALSAAETGIAVVIASGYGRNTILDLMDGHNIGTLILKSTYIDEQEGPEVITQRTKAASAVLRALSSDERSKILVEMSTQIKNNTGKILEANKKDIETAEKYGTSASLIARLKLTPEKIQSLAVGILQIAQAVDPVGRIISANQLADGLLLTQETTPLGVLLVIFESRPDAVPQLAALAIKSANGLLLKGGKEAQHSNQILHQILGQAIVTATNGKLSSDVIGLIQSREDINVLLSFEKDINLVIPRGSNKLVRDIQNATKIPVLGHSEGICHIYVHSDADIQKSIRVITDAKLDYPAACNAVESLLLNKELIDDDRAFTILSALHAAKIELCATPEVLSYASSRGLTLRPLVLSFHHEYGEPFLTVSFTDDFDTAVRHINEFGSSHTESILTESVEVAKLFQNRIDSACVFHNASTRFADGFRFGLGAEVGISTNRIHARGPVGVEGLLSTKWKLTSTSPEGDVASDFTVGKKKWLHVPMNPAKL